MVTGAIDVEEIYERMAVIRREHHENVRESLAGAEALVDWGRYAWTWHWVALGAASAIGCLLYARGHQRVSPDPSCAADAVPAREPVAAALVSSQKRSSISQNVVFAAWEILSTVAVRAGQDYMLHWLEQQFAARRVVSTAVTPACRNRGERLAPAKHNSSVSALASI